jgi:hypothetical protein
MVNFSDLIESTNETIEKPRNNRFINVVFNRKNNNDTTIKSNTSSSTTQSNKSNEESSALSNESHHNSLQPQPVPSLDNQKLINSSIDSISDYSDALDHLNTFQQPNNVYNASIWQSIADLTSTSDTLIKNSTTINDSLVSTADEHCHSQIYSVVPPNLLAFVRPKITSSMITLKQKNNIMSKVQTPKMKKRLDQSMTFLVESASTPKKTLPRSSTPNSIRISSKHSTNKKQQQKRQLIVPFSSTLISEKKTIPYECKQIPPPLLSSSIAGIETPQKVHHHHKKSKIHQCQKSNKKQQQQHDKRKQSVLKLKVQKQIKQIQTVTNKSFNKYPIKYFPNTKTIDIDRVNVQDECYNYGDYNVWFL